LTLTTFFSYDIDQLLFMDNGRTYFSQKIAELLNIAQLIPSHPNTNFHMFYHFLAQSTMNQNHAKSHGIQHAYVLHDLNRAISSVALVFLRGEKKLEIYGMAGFKTNSVFSPAMKTELARLMGAKFTDAMFNKAKYVRFDHKWRGDKGEISVDAAIERSDLLAEDLTHFDDLGATNVIRGVEIKATSVEGVFIYCIFYKPVDTIFYLANHLKIGDDGSPPKLLMNLAEKHKAAANLLNFDANSVQDFYRVILVALESVRQHFSIDFTPKHHSEPSSASIASITMNTDVKQPIGNLYTYVSLSY